ncbi:MAG TPA: hydrolase [Hyphomicrobiales bacterium]|nr:hydrolase [Kaistiaceae bacterium]HQF30010.1 hydrolase [Hyphomicrobiales bacterium]
MLMSAARSQLLVIDIQERLLPAMADSAAVLRNAGIVIAAARRLKVPVVLTEQYPKGLGPTVPEIVAAAGEARVFEKLAFSAMRDARTAKALVDRRGSGRPQVVVCGIEAHVCVLQTALDLKERGFDVFVVADAVSSRVRGSHETALQRMAAAGVVAVTAEMVAFEWVEAAGTDDFKAIARLVK